MRLFVDDTRAFPERGYQCCPDVKSAILMLSLMRFEHISLDYTLGYNGETGMDILRWMKENGVTVPEINIHSNHTVGREKMREFCEKNFPNTRVTMNMLPK